MNGVSTLLQLHIWREVDSVRKRVTTCNLKEHAPKEETLLTVLAEIEHSVKSRPLTVVASDPQEKEAPTPNHFLIGTSSATINLCQSIAEICTKK